MPLPNSLSWMESVDAKMIRAHEHIEALGRAGMEYLASIKIKLYLKTAPHLPNPWLVAVASDYIPPMPLSAILGDCIHNMRAALDNLVCGLARTQDRLCTCEDTAFPYTQNEADWNASIQATLAGVPKPAKKIIKSVQPWRAIWTMPNPLVMLEQAEQHQQAPTLQSRSRVQPEYLCFRHSLREWPRIRYQAGGAAVSRGCS